MPTGRHSRLREFVVLVNSTYKHGARLRPVRHAESEVRRHGARQSHRVFESREYVAQLTVGGDGDVVAAAEQCGRAKRVLGELHDVDYHVGPLVLGHA